MWTACNRECVLIECKVTKQKRLRKMVSEAKVYFFFFWYHAKNSYVGVNGLLLFLIINLKSYKMLKVIINTYQICFIELKLMVQNWFFQLSSFNIWREWSTLHCSNVTYFIDVSFWYYMMKVILHTNSTECCLGISFMSTNVFLMKT